jgi:hypothetical protein
LKRLIHKESYLKKMGKEREDSEIYFCTIVAGKEF